MVPFLDLRLQHFGLEKELKAAFARVLASSQFVLGDAVAEFETAFANYCGVKHAVGVNSGTSALHLALLAAEIGPGDEVITVPMTFVATTWAVIYSGARPVFVDVEPQYATMDVSRIEGAIGPRTRAILPVHLHGHPADMGPIVEIARRHGLVVIEDAAQAHAAHYKGRPAGSMGDMGCFSFYPGKNLGACGEAGLIVTDNDDYAATMRQLRDWGQQRRYHHTKLGFNYRMEGIQGAVLSVKLPHLPRWTALRRRHADEYSRLLIGAPVATPTEADWAESVFHVYAVRSRRRDDLQRHLALRGIQTGIHYPIPVHLQVAFRQLGFRDGDFPIAEEFAHSVLSLPMFPELTVAQQDEVADAVRSFRLVRTAA